MIGEFSVALLASFLQQPVSAPATRQEFQSHQATPTGFMRSVCHLFVVRRNARTGFLRRPVFNSSAFLYRDRYLVTAAHNVHSNALSWLLRADVACDAADSDQRGPQTSFRRDAVHVLNGYSFARRLPARYERDVAIVRLDRPICGIGAPLIDGTNLATDQAVGIAGYPGEGGDGGGMNGKRLYSGWGQLLRAPQPYLIRHNIVTEKGNSGGPVWIRRGDQDVVIAIHVGEDGTARPLDAALRAEIDGMIDRLESAQPTPLTARCARL